MPPPSQIKAPPFIPKLQIAGLGLSELVQDPQVNVQQVQPA